MLTPVTSEGSRSGGHHVFDLFVVADDDRLDVLDDVLDDGARLLDCTLQRRFGYVCLCVRHGWQVTTTR